MRRRGEVAVLVLFAAALIVPWWIGTRSQRFLEVGVCRVARLSDMDASALLPDDAGGAVLEGVRST